MVPIKRTCEHACVVSVSIAQMVLQGGLRKRGKQIKIMAQALKKVKDELNILDPPKMRD